MKVGDRVSFTYGRANAKKKSGRPRVVIARITEDRGTIGVGGRQIWRVQTDPDEFGNTIELEIPENELSFA